VLVPRLVESRGAGAVRLFALPGETLRVDEPWRSVEVVRGDVADCRRVSDAVLGCEVVLHLAGFISYRQADRARLFRVNAAGAANVARACASAGVRRLVHVSSTGATGFCRDGSPATESTPFNWPPAFHYMASKRAGQEAVRRVASESGLEAVIVSPAAIMGPGDANPATPHNRLYELARSSSVLPTFTGGLSVVDVRDVVDAVLRAIDVRAEPEPFLLAGANHRYSYVLRQIAAGFGRRARLVPIPAAAAAGAGFAFETLRMRHAPVTYAYGLMSGGHCYHDGCRGRQLMGRDYRAFEQTVEDGCRFYLEHIAAAR
jgi:nucleoside-diphosphate-sugar epimerase